MIKNIVFDMGNVLMNFEADRAVKEFFDTQEDRELIFKELFSDDWVQGDLGYQTPSERADNVCKRLPERLHESLRNCVNSMDDYVIPREDAHLFCEYLKKKEYPIYVLSNAGIEFYRFFLKFSELDFFNGIVVSSDIHIIKPDPGIYQYLLKQYNLIPEECLFIDDLEANVKAARELGMHAVVFKGNYDQIKAQYGL